MKYTCHDGEAILKFGGKKLSQDWKTDGEQTENALILEAI